MQPLVSVIVATYRRNASLKRALGSLATQTYGNLEIILVNDNDDPIWNETVQRIVREFEAYNQAVSLKYIENHPNQGSAITRNIGIAAADGEYITFLDDDDLYLPEKVENQVRFMKETGSDYSITDLALYNEKNKLVDRRIRDYIQSTDKNILTTYHLKYHLTGTDTMMFRKEYLGTIGGFAPIDVGDEYYLMQRAIDGGGKFGYLPGCEVMAYVHTGEGGLSSGEGKINGENALYQYKQQYFDLLSSSDRKYIRVRHYAVISYAKLRNKKFVSGFADLVRAFFISPRHFGKIIRK